MQTDVNRCNGESHANAIEDYKSNHVFLRYL